MKQATKRIRTVNDVLRDAQMCGNAYLPMAELVGRCCLATPRRTEAEVRAELERLLNDGLLRMDAQERIYTAYTYRYEHAAAQSLAARLSRNDTPLPETMDAVLAAVEPSLSVPLSQEQSDAIRACMSHRLTVITGGAGSGKTTLIHALWLAQYLLVPKGAVLLAAPTGKAARNLRERTGHTASTVHRALGKVPCDDFLDSHAFQNFWRHVNLVVVDEASMLSLEMLAGLLEHAKPDCRIVLVGDPNQLPAVGAGNVLNDLLALDVPCVHLTCNHRQEGDAGALLQNVVCLPRENCTTLEFDDSFRLIKAYSGPAAQKEICSRYLQQLAECEDVQILSPFRGFSDAGAAGLSRALQQRINPPEAHKFEYELGHVIYREGDRVLLTKNTDIACNGDIGYLHYRVSPDGYLKNISVAFPFGTQRLDSVWGLGLLDLAYAITIHKAQGSEYDTVIVPVLRDFGVMLTRNLLYTAISRARKRLILVGDEGALDKALTSAPPPRYSALTERVRAALRGKEGIA